MVCVRVPIFYLTLSPGQMMSPPSLLPVSPPPPIRELCIYFEDPKHSLKSARVKRPTSCVHNAAEQPLSAGTRSWDH